MGFLENLGKGISDFSQSTIQKGKDVANVAKFSRLISDEERAMSKLFEQLGRKYFDLRSEANEEDLNEANKAGLPAPLIKRLTLNKDKLRDLNDGLIGLTKLADPCKIASKTKTIILRRVDSFDGRCRKPADLRHMFYINPK